MSILCHMLVNLIEEKLNANEKLVNGKLQTEHFLFCLSGLLFDFFSPLEVLLSGTN